MLRGNYPRQRMRTFLPVFQRSCSSGLIVEIQRTRLHLMQDANLALPVQVHHLNQPSKHHRHILDTRALQTVAVRHAIAQLLLSPFLCTVSCSLPLLPVVAAAADDDDFASVVVPIVHAVLVGAGAATAVAAAGA